MVLPVSKVHFDLTSVLTALAQNAVIMETRGLTRCLLSETTTKTGEKETVLNTEGINMHEMFNHSDVCRQCWLDCQTLVYTHCIILSMTLHAGFKSRGQIAQISIKKLRDVTIYYVLHSAVCMWVSSRFIIATYIKKVRRPCACMTD